MNTLAISFGTHVPAISEQISEHVVFLIDGVDLVERVSREWVTNDHPGQYAGITPTIALLPSYHLLGTPDPEYELNGNPALLGCGGCGVFNCWPLYVTVLIGDGVVTWKDFDNPFLSDWGERAPSYRGLGAFTFDRRQYEGALRSMRGVGPAWPATS